MNRPDDENTTAEPTAVPPEAAAAAAPPAAPASEPHPLIQAFEKHRDEHRTRRRRARRLLRALPRRANVRRYPVIRWFAEAARKRPYLWSFKRKNIVPALYLGCVISFLPLYGVSLIFAFAAALVTRANLTVMVATQFITNFFTSVPIYLATHQLGMWLISVTHIGEGAGDIGRHFVAIFIGGVIGGLLCALLLDIGWRVVDWEAHHFRQQMHKLREAIKHLRHPHH